MDEEKKIVMFFCRDCLRVRAFKKNNKDKWKCLDCGREEENVVVQIFDPKKNKN